jgi:hypothetical protein
MDGSCSSSVVEHLNCIREGLDRSSSVGISTSNKKRMSNSIIGSVDLIEAICKIKSFFNLLESAVLLFSEDSTQYRKITSSNSSS